MKAFSKPTRSAKTEASYVRTYRMLVKQCNPVCEPHSLMASELIQYLIARRAQFSMSTWRQYKAAVIWYVTTQIGGYEDEIEQLRLISSVGLAKRSTLTSGKKRRTVSQEAWDLLRHKLIERHHSGCNYALNLWCVLAATLETGLRPQEWFNATIAMHPESNRLVLRVQNAKNSNGRANGEHRELFLDGLDGNKFLIIKRAIWVCQNQGPAAFESIQKQLIDEMTNVKLAIANDSKKDGAKVKGISMYSFRHQFLANAKKTFDDPRLIAALAGHHSTNTAFQHYGKRQFGSSLVKVTPTPESVDAVMNLRPQVPAKMSSPKSDPDSDIFTAPEM